MIADRNPHSRHDVHDEKMHPVKQRITDIVSVEGDADNCDHANGTEEKTGFV